MTENKQIKQISLNIPDYLTVEKYVAMNSYKGDSDFGRLIHSVSALTGLDKSEVRMWSPDSLVKVSNLYSEVADSRNEFHPLIEWNGQLLGYSNIRNVSLGEYIDLENLSKDLENNLHKIAAILYRPVTKHRFDSISFTIRQRIKMINNKVENVFDWYELEKYSSDKRREVEETFKQFPIHILLGAISFFLTNASLYFNHIAYSDNKMTLQMKEILDLAVLESLLVNIGGGSGLSTTSVSPIYYQLQDSLPS